MKDKKIFTVGIIGTVLTLLCCATPLLVILLGAVGLGAITGYLDYVLMPLLVAFVGLTIYAYGKQNKKNINEDCCHPKKEQEL
ncbi:MULTISPECIES: mercury resistance system transport protein MerF [Paenibacillaceae]|uniref:mercury resistance system transport protein MerF n=1 Tax=Paenibacillaceae TaxID=186822 RepID=UPI0025B65DA6|nr:MULTISPECIES: mercury resistance system transport protein MerF [Paenibacillaceae]MDN4094585.1 mercury resistance system transport protein MerF [Brevibacillus agri]MED0677494.1 mercury resistance system transport protein MerF [Aneurinibacillus thermoaerophilus]MED3500537.1 mercury resistance system transport protein MerF [Brevibacillus agri]